MDFLISRVSFETSVFDQRVCRTKFSELSTCEVQRLTQLRSTFCIRIDLNQTFDSICWEYRLQIMKIGACHVLREQSTTALLATSQFAICA